MSELTEHSILMTASRLASLDVAREYTLGIKPTRLVLAHPWNTPYGKATALRVIISRLTKAGCDVGAYKRELATCE